jgi:hypothetical protein
MSPEASKQGFPFESGGEVGSNLWRSKRVDKGKKEVEMSEHVGVQVRADIRAGTPGYSIVEDISASCLCESHVYAIGVSSSRRRTHHLNGNLLHFLLFPASWPSLTPRLTVKHLCPLDEIMLPFMPLLQLFSLP